MKKLLLTLFLALVPLSVVHAEVEVVNFVFDDTVTRYQVPDGKTLILEHLIWALDSDASSQIVSITPSGNRIGVGSFQLRFPLPGNAPQDRVDLFTFPRPMRIGSRGAITVLAVWRDAAIMGLLVDNEDLYAAKIDTELKSSRLAGGRLQSDVKYASPRPRITKVESAESLGSFTADSSGEVERTASPGTSIASVTASSNRKFIRVLAKARETE